MHKTGTAKKNMTCKNPAATLSFNPPLFSIADKAYPIPKEIKVPVTSTLTLREISIYTILFSRDHACLESRSQAAEVVRLYLD